MKLDIVAFTARGAGLAEKIINVYPDSEATAPERYCSPRIKPLHDSLSHWTQARFKKGRILIFIGSAGIAARTVAPFLKSKSEDAAVICVDEYGKNIIPLLSGHMGGANRAARKLAEVLGARAVLTTATDLGGVFAVDSWAVKNNCAIPEPSAIKRISAALLNGETVGLCSEFPVEGRLPKGVSLGADAEKGIEVAFKSTNPFPCTLHLVPRILIAGVGCRRGGSADSIEQRLRAELLRVDVPLEAVGMIASIDRKAKERGLLELSERISAEFVTFGAEALMSARGEFAKSERVLRITGTDNVCERAVACAGGEIFLRKSSADGITIALGRFDWKASFEEVEN